MVKKILPRYTKIVNGEAQANFQISRRILVDFDKSLGVNQLWQLHQKLMKKFYEIKHVIDIGKLRIGELEIPRFSLIDLKILLVKELLKNCELCERKCGVNRIDGDKGECGVGKTLISSEFIHMDEEPYISPSYTVFFMGCNLHCCYCQNWAVSQWFESGYDITPQQMAKRIENVQEECRNVNWVGGEPTPNLLFVLGSLKQCEANIPIVWNSNFYMSEKTMQLLDGVVDLYLSDFKYGNDACASSLSRVKNYFEICSRNHILAAGQAELSVRHLVLPGHVECCSKPIIKWIAKNIRKKCIVNIMDQYRPDFHAKERMDLNRNLTSQEFNGIVGYAKKQRLNYIT